MLKVSPELNDRIYRHCRRVDIGEVKATSEHYRRRREINVRDVLHTLYLFADPDFHVRVRKEDFFKKSGYGESVVMAAFDVLSKAGLFLCDDCSGNWFVGMVREVDFYGEAIDGEAAEVL